MSSAWTRGVQMKQLVCVMQTRSHTLTGAVIQKHFTADSANTNKVDTNLLDGGLCHGTEATVYITNVFWSDYFKETPIKHFVRNVLHIVFVIAYLFRHAANLFLQKYTAIYQGWSKLAKLYWCKPSTSVGVAVAGDVSSEFSPGGLKCPELNPLTLQDNQSQGSGLLSSSVRLRNGVKIVQCDRSCSNRKKKNEKIASSLSQAQSFSLSSTPRPLLFFHPFFPRLSQKLGRGLDTAIDHILRREPKSCFTRAGTFPRQNTAVAANVFLVLVPFEPDFVSD